MLGQSFWHRIPLTNGAGGKTFIRIVRWNQPLRGWFREPTMLFRLTSMFIFCGIDAHRLTTQAEIGDGHGP